jgi:hypothetical protein
MPASSSMSVKAATPGSNHVPEIAVSSVHMGVRSALLSNWVRVDARCARSLTAVRLDVVTGRPLS